MPSKTIFFKIWWPMRLLRWFYGFTGRPCMIFVGKRSDKEQPFEIFFGIPDRSVFFWSMNLSTHGMKALIKDLQVRVDLYETFNEEKLT